MNKSSAAPGRFSKVAAALLALAGGSSAQEAALSAADEALVERGKRIVENAPTMAPPATWDKARAEAGTLLERLRGDDPTLRAARRRQVEKARHGGRGILVFVSFSLGEQGLDDALSAVSGRAEATAVFRGVPDGMSLVQGIAAIRRLAAGKDPPPAIVIDPTLFRAYDIGAVPSVVIVAAQAGSEEKPRPVARVAGLADPRWLLRAVEGGETGDLGIRGPLAAIAEADPITVAGRRLAAIDWEEKKRGAIARFWAGQRFNELPPAKKARTREIDPSVTITRDIVTTDGAVLAHAGEVVDPLCTGKEKCAPGRRRFTEAVVVFDPLDARQVKTLSRALPAIRREPGVRRVTWIATRLDREKGWDGYREVTAQVDAPVYLLTAEIVSRFALEHTPSVITARGGKFLIRELAAEEQ